MCIVWSDGHTADPEGAITTKIRALRAWWRTHRAERLEERYGGTWLRDWRRVAASPVIGKKAATKGRISG